MPRRINLLQMFQDKRGVFDDTLLHTRSVTLFHPKNYLTKWVCKPNYRLSRIDYRYENTQSNRKQPFPVFYRNQRVRGIRLDRATRWG